MTTLVTVIILPGGSSKLSWRRKAMSDSVYQGMESKWKPHPSVSRTATASLVRIIPCTGRKRLNQRYRLHYPGGESKCWEGIRHEKHSQQVHWYLDTYPPCLYQTLHLKGLPLSCRKAGSSPITLQLSPYQSTHSAEKIAKGDHIKFNSFSLAANTSSSGDCLENGQ